MNTNPDNKNYTGLGTQSKIPETTLDSRYLIPSTGMLRFIERANPDDESRTVRILQQYQWCMDKNEFDWYDIPSVHESDV